MLEGESWRENAGGIVLEEDRNRAITVDIICESVQAICIVENPLFICTIQQLMLTTDN